MSDSATTLKKAIESAGQATPWHFPPVNGAPVEQSEPQEGDPSEPADTPQLPTPEEIVRWQQEGRDEGYRQGQDQGYQKGYQDGLVQGQQETAEKIAIWSALIDALRRPFEQLDEQVEHEIRVMIVALAQQLVRREIHSEPGEIIGLIRESMARLPAYNRDITITLHPDDAVLVRQALVPDDQVSSWTLREDTLISRGGCRISTDVSMLDATLEAQLAALATTLLGGERAGDQPLDTTRGSGRD